MSVPFWANIICPLRTGDVYKRQPLILASGYPTKEFKARINELGPQAFLSKPYNTPDILQTVRKALDGSKAMHLAA